ncbi:class I SAM-dependent methyltransferase [Planctomycetota bacterium]
MEKRSFTSRLQSLDAKAIREMVYQQLDANPMFTKGMEVIAADAGDQYWLEVKDHLIWLDCYLDRYRSGVSLETAFNSFITLTFDYFKLQNELVHTKRTFSTNEQESREKVYDNIELMEGPYLQGLFLALYFWPNHYHMVQWFRREFLPLLHSHKRVLEIGPGHGFFTAEMLCADDSIALEAIDIAGLAVRMTRRMLAIKAPDALDRLQCRLGSFTGEHQKASRRYDAILFSEVLEHIENPGEGLRILHGQLAQDGVMLCTTAINAAFYDHLTIFKTIAEIDRLFDESGFEILKRHEEFITELADGSSLSDYFALLRRKTP